MSSPTTHDEMVENVGARHTDPPMSRDRLDFLIIGATKSATTWLQRSLQADPSVYMPDPELHFFSREFDRGLDWYLAQFAVSRQHKTSGEKSNSYLESEEAASRIRTTLPNVRLIAQLRNPVERAYSDYCMLYRRGEVGRDIAAYLDPRQAMGTRFLESGLYHRQLSRYLDLFPPDQLLVVLFEDIALSPAAHLSRVRRFLGLNKVSVSHPVASKVKDKHIPVLPPTMRRWLGPLKPLVAPLRETSQFVAVRNRFARQPHYPALTNHLRDRLVEYYRPDVELLSETIQRDLSDWISPAAAPA